MKKFKNYRIPSIKNASILLFVLIVHSYADSEYVWDPPPLYYHSENPLGGCYEHKVDALVTIDTSNDPQTGILTITVHYELYAANPSNSLGKDGWLDENYVQYKCWIHGEPKLPFLYKSGGLLWNENNTKIYKYYVEFDPETDTPPVSESVEVKVFAEAFCCPGHVAPLHGDACSQEGEDTALELENTIIENYTATWNPSPILALSKSQVDFGTSSTLQNFNVQNDGGQTLTWDSDKSYHGWFGYSPTAGNLLGGDDETISVTANRLLIPQEELQNKDHYGNISFTSNGGSESVQIKVSLEAPVKPQNLDITNEGSQGQNPHLTWDAVSLVYRYKVERRNVTESGNFVELASVESNSYTDSEVFMYAVGGDEYEYRVRASNGGGNSAYSDPVSTEGLIFEAFDSGGPKTLMFDLPKQVQLDNSYPNPGNPGTMIRFGLPEDGQVSLKVFNVRGELVRTLIHGLKPAGVHEIYWDGLNDQGNAVVSGLYIVFLESGGKVYHKKFSLIK